jgi:hypothetical protein
MELTNTEYIMKLTNTEGPTPFTINKEPEPAIPEPVYVLKKVRAPERYLPNGKYNSKPLSPTYVKDYYARTRGDVECPHCLKMFKHKDTLRNHIKRSNKCILQRENNRLKEALESLKVKNDVTEAETVV